MIAFRYESDMDTYDFYGGNLGYDQAREIVLRGIASDYPKGWSTRMHLLKEVTENKGLREARFAFYVGMDVFNQQLLEEEAPEGYTFAQGGIVSLVS